MRTALAFSMALRSAALLGICARLITAKPGADPDGVELGVAAGTGTTGDNDDDEDDEDDDDDEAPSARKPEAAAPTSGVFTPFSPAVPSTGVLKEVPLVASGVSGRRPPAPPTRARAPPDDAPCAALDAVAGAGGVRNDSTSRSHLTSD